MLSLTGSLPDFKKKKLNLNLKTSKKDLINIVIYVAITGFAWSFSFISLSKMMTRRTR
jgi:hypothetical protein